MKAIIVYGSVYGSAKRYADKLAQTMGIQAVDCKQILDLKQYNDIVYFGGLYAGGVKGLKHITPKIPKTAKLILATVGLADTNNAKNKAHIKQCLRKQLSEKQYQTAEIFHLRGAIGYSRLNFWHKTMMALLYHTVKKQPQNKQTADTKEMIETYNQAVDFVDFNQLLPIAEILRKTESGRK